MEQNEDFLSLLQLNSLIGEALSMNFVDHCMVVAEIADIRVAQRGHCYIELVEKKDEQVVARSRANLWANRYGPVSSRFLRETGQQLNAGMKVLFQVQVGYHPVYGISLTVLDIDPSYSLGEMARKRKEVWDKLVKEGVAGLNQDLELPTVIQKIAIISSPTAAGLEDFQDQLLSNEYGYDFQLTLFPAIMQGAQTTESIVMALDEIRNHIQEFQVVLIIRGGGSKIDLHSFDTYELGREVALFPLPVVSGIGHERDESIVDMVAHTDLKTPTAVAEFLIARAVDFESRLIELSEILRDKVRLACAGEKEYLMNLGFHLKESVSGILTDEKQKFKNLEHRLERNTRELINQADRNLSRISSLLVREPGAKLIKESLALNMVEEKLKLYASQRLKREEEHLTSLEKLTRMLDPIQVLERGYALVQKGDDILTGVKNASEGDQLIVKMRDGDLHTLVKAKEEK